MMKNALILYLCFASVIVFGQTKGSIYGVSAGTQFVENRGQVADGSGKPYPSVLYTGELGSGVQSCFFKNSFSYIIRKKEPKGYFIRGVNIDPVNEDPLKGERIIAVQRIDVEFMNCNTNPVLEMASPTGGMNHFYLANCPDGVHAASGRSITYKELYPGIDVVFMATGSGTMEYDFVLKPGADPSVIQMRYAGHSGISLSGDVLHVKTITGEINEIIPQVYQTIADKKVQVKGAYQLQDSTVGFNVSGYKMGLALVIDPWITYITSTVGGHNTTSDNNSYAQGLVIDTGGNIIVEGYTNSPNFPVTPGVFQDTINGAVYSTDIFVAKFDTGGNRLWATYYGGTNYEITYPRGVGTDGEGNIVFTSAIRSNDFPVTPGCFQSTFGGGQYDACVVKLTPQGTRIWATYCGGSGDELGAGLFVEPGGNIVTTGGTKSFNFPVSPGAFQATNRTSSFYNAYIIMLNPTGARKWATYYGGSVSEIGQGITIDKTGNVVVVSTTISADFPVSTGAFQTVHAGPTGLGHGSGDITIVKFDSLGNRLWSTFYGSTGQDAAVDVTTDTAANIYIVGSSYYSTTFPTTPGVFKTTSENNGDIVVLKFSPAGARIWATLIGGTRQDLGHAIAIDEQHNVYLCGLTTDVDPFAVRAPNDFPVTSCAYQTKHGGNGFDWWFAKMDPTARYLCYSSYLGDTSYGNGYAEHCNDLAYQHSTFYMCGYAQGKISIPSNFPVTPGAFQTNPAGTFCNDGVLASIDIGSKGAGGFSAVNPAICTGGAVNFNSSAGAFCNSLPSASVGYQWYFPGGTPATSTAANPTGIIYNATGSFDVTLVINTPCGIDSIVKPSLVQVSQWGSETVSASPAALCPGDSSALLVVGSSGNIQWQISTDSISFTDIQGATGTNYTVFGLSQPTYFRVKTSGGGCGGGFSAAVKVTVSSGAAVAGVITANPDSVCEGSPSALTLSGSAGNIQWQLATGGNNFINLTVPDTVSYTTPPLMQSTLYRVIAGSGNCTDTSLIVNISVKPLPLPPSVTVADTLICSSDSTQVCAQQGFSSYLWNTGSTSACIYVKNAGAYWLSATGANGCTVMSARTNIDVYPALPISIIVKGDTLASFSAISYQWYMDDDLIQGATSSVYVARQTGFYSVQVADSNGCFTTSSPVYVEVTGIEDGYWEEGITIYPNPFANTVFVNTNGAMPITQVYFYDLLGQVVLSNSEALTLYPIVLDTSPLPAGIYFIELRSGTKQLKAKLSKQ